MATDPEIRRIRALRLRAQGLVPGARAWSTASEAARGMLAIQAQDAAGARWALSLRASSRPDDTAVLTDLLERRIVRNRPSRGTLQITSAEDMHWLSATFTERSRAEAARRRPQLDLTDAMVDGAEATVRAALSGEKTLTRAELVAACAAAGVELNTYQAGHVLRHLTELMAIVFADPRVTPDAFAAADEWITERHRPEHALGEAVSRFVAARGPVTRQDFGKWAYLPMASVDAGIEAAGDALDTVTLAGTAYLIATGSADITDGEVDDALATPLLLPAFDEYIIGYGSRAPQLDEQYLARIVPGRNGIFKPMVVVDGEIAGTWSRKVSASKSAPKVSVTVEPFTTIRAAAMRRLAAPVAEYGRFLGCTAALI